MTAKLKNIIFLIISTLVGIGLMIWLYRGFDFSSLRVFFSQPTNYVFIVMVLVVGIMANVLRSLRWRMLLQSAHIEITLRRSVELVFISYLINSVTPRLGELTRSLLVRSGDEIGRAHV